MNMLVICLAQILLSSILLFVYFKSRIGKVEEKLDIMFQLVQSHTSQRNSMKIYENHENNKNNDINDINDINNINNEVDNLINVSDESDESDESDSDESNTESDESDDESDEKNELVIGENIKKISLNLESDVELPIVLEKKLNDIEVFKGEELGEELDETVVEMVEEMVEEMVDETVGMVEFDYDSCKVVELKALCEERNLENYKRLRKPELIELLKNN